MSSILSYKALFRSSLTKKRSRYGFPPSKPFGPHTPLLSSQPSHADHLSLHSTLERRLRLEKFPCNSNASAPPRLDNSWAGMYIGMSFGHGEAIKLRALITDNRSWKLSRSVVFLVASPAHLFQLDCICMFRHIAFAGAGCGKRHATSGCTQARVSHEPA